MEICSVSIDLARYESEQARLAELDDAAERENEANRKAHIKALKASSERLLTCITEAIENEEVSSELLARLLLALANGGGVGDESVAQVAARLVSEACEADADQNVKTVDADDMAEIWAAERAERRYDEAADEFYAGRV